MEIRTFYYNKNIDSEIIELTGDEFFHATKVDRIRVGDQVRIINNTENEYICVINEINKNCAKLNIIKKQLCLQNPKIDVDVFLCLLKGDKNDNLISKLSELGVKNLTFITSQNVERKNEVNFERLHKLAITSAKQCGRSKILNINNKILKFSNLTNLKKYYNNVIVFYENEKHNTLNNVGLNNGKTAIIIGSEGGFLKNEITTLNELGAISVSLGKLIFRAETAAIIATSLTIFKLGGFNK